MDQRTRSTFLAILAAPLFTALMTSSSFANGFPEWCLEAIEKGDTAQAQEYADMVMEGGREFDPETVEQAQACVKQVTGKDVVYLPDTYDFLSPQEAIERQEAAVRRAKQRADRHSAVYAKLREGCAELYRRDQATAITIPACFDHFMAAGLPE